MTLALTLAFLTLGAPRALSAQEIPIPSQEKLLTFTRTYVAIGKIRDEIQAQLAQIGNKTAEAQARLREQMKERTAEAIQGAGLTPEEYEQITFVVAFNDEQRKAFEATLAQVTAVPTP
ncbi:MAG: DUF4168 domain-containing protein [Gemmatimonadetes bacterium]|nr:DUF4168 domain-containing protein [Gemmatimonadota bacterium]